MKTQPIVKKACVAAACSLLFSVSAAGALELNQELMLAQVTTETETNTLPDQPMTQDNMPPAPAPDINIDLPDNNFPDLGTDREVYERSETTILDNTDPDDVDTMAETNAWYWAFFGMLAVVLIAIVGIAYSRRGSYNP